MHALFTTGQPSRAPSARSRARTQIRRLRHWLTQFSWFGIFAVLAGLSAVVLAIADQTFRTVIALGFLSCTLAVLSTKET